ncbi:MAG: glycosyltransferase family 1 protein [Anaerolineae bacterium]
MIGIDYTPAYEQRGGIGRYVRELIGALAQIDSHSAYRLLVLGGTGQILPPLPGPNFSYMGTSLSPLMLARLWHRAHIPLYVETFTKKIRLFHATDFVLPPTRRRTRTLLTVHDLSFVRVPESASPRLKAYLDAVVPRSCRRADHILADSQATKDDLISLYGLPDEKITVLYSGVDARFQPITDLGLRRAVRNKYKLGSAPYILAVGTIQPRKNYERLMQAVATLPSAFNGVKLVISGGKGWLDGPIHALAKQLGSRVQMIGYAEDEDLPALYAESVCVAFPSLYEGFGLPVLEGMASGVPVLTSNVSCLPEVAGDAALMVDPYSVEAIRDGLITLLEGDQRERIARGIAQAKRFSWHDAARKLREIYQQLA